MEGTDEQFETNIFESIISMMRSEKSSKAITSKNITLKCFRGSKTYNKLVKKSQMELGETKLMFQAWDQKQVPK